MFTHSTTVIRLFGIKINIAASWILIAVLMTWTLSDRVFPLQLPGLAAAQYAALGLTTMVLFFLSLVLHELAHALVAKAFGLEVPRITLFLFGGVAELGNEPDTAAHEFWIALAGPLMSLALAGLFWLMSAAGAGATVQTVTRYLAMLNLVLAVFNMLPAFPLDGGRVLRAALWSRSGDIVAATETSTRLGESLGLVLTAMGVFGLFQGLTLGGAWQIVIGLFIILAARSARDTARADVLLGNQTVSDLMTADVIAVAPGVSLAALVDDIMLPHRVSFVPVIEDGTLLGHVDTHLVSMIDRDNWTTTQVGDVFVGLDQSQRAAPHDRANDVLKRMAGTGGRKMIVVDDRAVVGVITLADLMRQLELLVALKSPNASVT